MPAKTGVQFEVKLKNRVAVVPNGTIDVPANSSFVLPFNLDLRGLRLRHATAQPVCGLQDGSTSYFVFSEVEGVPAEFVFDAGQAIATKNCTVDRKENLVRLHQIKTGLEPFAELKVDNRVVKLLLLTDDVSRQVWKISPRRIVITPAEVVYDNQELSFKTLSSERLSFSVLPAIARVTVGERSFRRSVSGDFLTYSVPPGTTRRPSVRFEQVKQAGPAREIKKGSQGVAEAPVDSDFDQAAVWRIRLTQGDAANETLLRVNYVGDVARIYLDGEFLTDNFYNGNPFELGLNRYRQSIYRGELLLKVLPLRKDAPIYLAEDAWPVFSGNQSSVAKVLGMELIEKTTTRVRLG
jgi:hypothetical protein